MFGILHLKIKLCETFVRIALLFVCGVMSNILFAQSLEPMMINISGCVHLDSTLERFECYEKQAEPFLKVNGVNNDGAEGLQSADNPEGEEVQQISEMRTSRITEVVDENFGFSEEQIEQKETEEVEETRVELIATVSSVRELMPNRRVVSLENGQVWRQMRAEQYNLHKGQEVHIFSTKWGASYRLTVESLGGYIQVERIK